MKIIVALIMSLLTGVLAYIAFNINFAHKIRIFKREDELCRGINQKPISLWGKIWVVFVVIISFFLTLIIFNRANEIIGVLRLLLSLICLSGASYFDFEEKRIPNIFPVTMLLGSTILLLLGIILHNKLAVSQLVESIIVALVCFLGLTLASVLSKGGIGAGDIKLLSALALSSGSLVIIGTVFYSILYCGIGAGYLLVTKKMTKKEGVPFAPFILLGFVTTIFFNNI